MATQQQPPRGNKPGAMTMAMQAVQTVQGPKVLRIGMIQGGKIIEERIIRTRDTVSVGTTERNTFTVVGPDLPGHLDLFQMVAGSYKLNFSDAMDGRVAMPSGVMSLKQLKESGQAVKSNVGWQVPLNEQCRGKVSIGDVQFLFQFVAPPPPQPKPQLPAAIRAGWVKNIDWTYNACLAFFLLFAFSGLAYVEYLYDPIIEDAFALDARIVQLATPPAVQEPEPEQTQQQQPDNTQQQQAAAQPTQQTNRPAQNAGTAEQRAARAAAQADSASRAAERAASAALSALQNSAEFAALTGATDTGRGSAADRLAQGGLMQGSVDALANTGGIQNAAGQGGGLRRGGMSASAGGIAGGGGLGGGRAIEGGGAAIGGGGTVVVERRISGNASLGSGDAEGGEGTLDASRVAGILRSNIGGIRSCYERALRNNPTLSGRLEIHFTIGTSGRVTGSPSTSGLAAAPEVGSCIASRVRGLVFPAPEGGAVEFSFPFNFSPGG